MASQRGPLTDLTSRCDWGARVVVTPVSRNGVTRPRAGGVGRPWKWAWVTRRDMHCLDLSARFADADRAVELSLCSPKGCGIRFP